VVGSYKGRFAEVPFCFSFWPCSLEGQSTSTRPCAKRQEAQLPKVAVVEGCCRGRSCCGKVGAVLLDQALQPLLDPVIAAVPCRKLHCVSMLLCCVPSSAYELSVM
jgi:hypothetical protein